MMDADDPTIGFGETADYMAPPTRAPQPVPTGPRRWVTAGERRVLTLMAESDDGELVHSIPGGWWVDLERVSERVCLNLLRKVLIRRDSFSRDDCEIYSLNEEGRAALADPNYEPKIFAALRGAHAPR